jgi:Fe-S-cluster containining protein
MKEYSCRKRCGYCCTLRVKLSWKDILRILFHTKHRYRDFVERDAGRQKVLRMNGRHCFFERRKNGKSSCLIYRHRPWACRVFPYFNDDIKSCGEIKKFNQRFARAL